MSAEGGQESFSGNNAVHAKRLGRKRITAPAEFATARRTLAPMLR
jgi:hypothetical protein